MIDQTATSVPADNRPHPWDPERIGHNGVLHHLAETFRIHFVEDVARRESVRNLVSAMHADTAVTTSANAATITAPSARGTLGPARGFERRRTARSRCHELR